MLLLSLCAGTVYFASGSGPGVAEPVPPRREIPVEDVPALQPDLEDFESDGEFNAWLKHPEDVFEPNLIRLSIRLFPDTNRFPGMQESGCESVLTIRSCKRRSRGGCLGAVVEHTDREPSAVAYPAREGTGSGGTRILSACDSECVGAAGGCAAV